MVSTRWHLLLPEFRGQHIWQHWHEFCVRIHWHECCCLWLEVNVAESKLNYNNSFPHRRFISTWGLSHRLKRIQDAEDTALQHNNRVAEGVYRQNRANETQFFVQTYSAENQIFPNNILDNIDKNEQECRKEMDEEEKVRMKRRHENLLSKKELAEQRKAEVRGLSSRNRVSSKNRSDLLRVLERVSKGRLLEFLDTMSPQEWRHWLVRTVCLAEGMFTV